MADDKGKNKSEDSKRQLTNTKAVSAAARVQEAMRKQNAVKAALAKSNSWRTAIEKQNAIQESFIKQRALHTGLMDAGAIAALQSTQQAIAKQSAWQSAGMSSGMIAAVETIRKSSAFNAFENTSAMIAALESTRLAIAKQSAWQTSGAVSGMVAALESLTKSSVMNSAMSTSSLIAAMESTKQAMGKHNTWQSSGALQGVIDAVEKIDVSNLNIFEVDNVVSVALEAEQYSSITTEENLRNEVTNAVTEIVKDVIRSVSVDSETIFLGSEGELVSFKTLESSGSTIDKFRNSHPYLSYVLDTLLGDLVKYVVKSLIIISIAALSATTSTTVSERKIRTEYQQETQLFQNKVTAVKSSVSISRDSDGFNRVIGVVKCEVLNVRQDSFVLEETLDESRVVDQLNQGVTVEVLDEDDDTYLISYEVPDGDTLKKRHGYVHKEEIIIKTN